MATNLRKTTKATPAQNKKMNTPSEIKINSPKAKDSGKKTAPKAPSNLQTKSLGAKQGSFGGKSAKNPNTKKIVKSV